MPMTEERLREIVEGIMGNDDRTLADVDLADELRAHADELAALRKDRERIKPLVDALLVYANEDNWKCSRCGKQDSLNCFMSNWTGPVNEEDGQAWDIARGVLKFDAAMSEGGGVE